MRNSLIVLLIAIVVLCDPYDMMVGAQNPQNASQQIVLQASQVSAVVNGTTTRATTTGLGDYESCDVLLNITGAGAATGTVQVFIEDSADAGTTWDDLISSNTFAFGSALVRQHFFITGQIATSGTQGGNNSLETLAAGTVRNGPWGDRVRVREVITLISGVPTGATYTINAVCKR